MNVQTNDLNEKCRAFLATGAPKAQPKETLMNVEKQRFRFQTMQEAESAPGAGLFGPVGPNPDHLDLAEVSTSILRWMARWPSGRRSASTYGTEVSPIIAQLGDG